ncbi:MAG: double-cubane-cluster-containing anaerobic reductase [Deferrisomatales bacterium]
MLEPLLEERYSGDPRRAALSYLLRRREEGAPVVGAYCSYAPSELVWALGGEVAGLCGSSREPIAAAQRVLPANLCPLIKSSYGFILTATCPFFELSDAVVAETTCDGKKKMFELIRDRKPFHLLELPHLPDDPDSQALWAGSVRKLKVFLEQTFGREITDEALEEAIADSNRRRALVLQTLSYAEQDPPCATWDELTALTLLGRTVRGKEGEDLLSRALQGLADRRRRGLFAAPAGAPRVLVTGCPVQGDAAKVFRLIEQAGGVIVAQEACTGIKPLAMPVEEGTGDPLAALARRYLQIPCSVMTPNPGRLALLDDLVARYRPHCVIDVVLYGCHTYGVESHTVGAHVKRRHGLAFLTLETDYSANDLGPLRNRIEALVEMVQAG